jgi:hypothetical protein
MLNVFLITSLAVGEILTYPKVPIQKEYYPSGVKEADEFYSTDLPSKTYPLLTLDRTAYDIDYNRIDGGIYAVEYSRAKNMLFIKDADSIIKAPVIQVITMKNKVYIPTAKVAFVKNKKIIIIYKKDFLEVHAFLSLPEALQ